MLHAFSHINPCTFHTHLDLRYDPKVVALLSRIVVFTAVLFYHTIWHAPTYHRKFAKSQLGLSLHVVTGLFEYFRYWLSTARSKFYTSQTAVPLPDELDLLCSLVWSWTSLMLVRTLRRGDPLTTRPPYQVAACMRPFATAAAYLFRIPSLHTLSVYTLEGFIWTRLAIFYFSRTPYLNDLVKASTIYAISVPLAAVFSIHQSQVPGASVVFLLAMSLTRSLNQWVSRQSQALRE